ncbi:MAG: PGF-pre-PGF domain-containing protein, partial [Methanosarcinaceae archaeon]|nr:PGF-pre-PGF domain-containing protein [Methanosarcinaceae archaeon]
GPLESVKDKEQKFGVETSRECNLSWYINGSLVQEDSNTTYAEYKNNTAPAGVYNVTVIASGDNESDQWTWIWKVIPVPDTSSGKDRGGTGGSGGSGGGGGGGSPEPASNVEIKELAQAFVTKGIPVSFNFVRNATCVNYVKFDSLKTAGKVTTIVEMLKGQSRLVPELPPAKVYKNLNIWVGNSGFATPENLENSLVGFRVEKTWLEGAGVDAASIILWKYEDNGWKQLETGKVGEDSDSIFFEAGTPGFSSFAITGGQVRSKTELGQLEEDSGQKALNSDVSKSENSGEGEESRNATDENRLPGFGLIGVVFGLLFSVVIEKRKLHP